VVVVPELSEEVRQATAPDVPEHTPIIALMWSFSRSHSCALGDVMR
jgi:hypothetical protein